MKEPTRKLWSNNRHSRIFVFLQNNTDMLSFILLQPLYNEILKCTVNKNQGVTLLIVLIKTPNFQPEYKNGHSFIIYKQNYKPLTMVPCGIFKTQYSAKCLLKIWRHMLCNQFWHTTLEVLYTE